MLLVALGLPALIGAAGYGTDMAQLYMWKRELQHSVDQAALAGAYTLADDATSTKYETRAMQEFTANQGITAGIASTPQITLAKYGGGDEDGNANSVIVSASAQKMLPFSGFLTNSAMYIHVSAQATFTAGSNAKACLMTLKKDASGTFTIGGNATVKANCGLGAMSCTDGALSIDGSADVTTDSIAVCGNPDVPDDLKGKVTKGSLTNPFADLPAPEPTDDTAKTFSCPHGKNAPAMNVLSPGRFTGGLNIQCAVTFSSGVYVIDGGTFDITDQKANVIGHKVLFVLKNGAKISLGGQGNAGTADLTPMEAGDFVGTANEEYKDLYASMLFYEDSTGQTDPVDHKIAGNANVSLRGTIYLPNGDVSVTGDSATDPLCFQIWSNTISISGNTKLTTTCTSDETNPAGSTAGGVKLVA